VRDLNNENLLIIIIGSFLLKFTQMKIEINESIKLCKNLIYEDMKNRVTMEMTRNKQKATLYTLQRRNETWNVYSVAFCLFLVISIVTRFFISSYIKFLHNLIDSLISIFICVNLSKKDPIIIIKRFSLFKSRTFE
jgi:hypothetical protein